MSSLLLNAAAIICFVAGKSGGHLLPCITKANQIQTQNTETKLYLFSSGSPLDHTIIDKHKNITHLTPTVLDNPPYQQPWLMPWFAIKTFWYFCKTVYMLHQIKPNKIISFGGFVSIPVCLASKLLGIPFEIYELNVEPGKSTNFLAKFTDTVYTCFDATKTYFPNKKCIHFDYPIRFTKNDVIFNKPALLAKYHLDVKRKTIVILGGSQGSILLNQVFKDCIQKNPALSKTLQVVHQTGVSDPFNYQEFYQAHDIPCVVFGYHERLQDFYNLSDLIICRAGAGTLFEILFFNKKCITIPHETANTNHQIKNVIALQKEHADLFSIIKQSEFNEQTLLPYIENV